MTGPQHYTEAERLLALVADWSRQSFTDQKRHDGHAPLIAPADIVANLAAAQVHATLAQAAATALALAGQFTLADSDAWQNVAGGGVT